MNPAPGIPVLVGSTAVGKTAVSLHLARALGAEIVSVDSRQVYRGMEIGSAAPTEAERAVVRHHLVGEQDPRQPLTAGQYGRRVRRVVAALAERGVPALLVGGSGLYLRAALGGFDADLPSDPAVRARWNERLRREGPQALHAELASLDPERAGELAPGDGVRLVRALELHELTGQLPSTLRSRGREAETRARIVVLVRDKEDLESRIRARVDAMIREGLKAEVEALAALGVPPESPLMKSVGYAETLRHRAGDLDAAAWREAMVINTRRYGKRQRTWFRGLADAVWIHLEAGIPAEAASERVLQAFRRLAP